jgi:hypothetical protein
MPINKKLKVVPIPKKPETLTTEDLVGLTSRRGLIELLKSKNINSKSALRVLRYEAEQKTLIVSLRYECFAMKQNYDNYKLS